VGLDIEPDAAIYLQIMDNPWGLVPMLAARLADQGRPPRSKAAYQALVDQIRADGWQVPLPGMIVGWCTGHESAARRSGSSPTRGAGWPPLRPR
jgi:hypothetical protein